MEGMMSSGPDVLIQEEEEDASDSDDCDSFLCCSLCCSLFNSWSCFSLEALPLLLLLLFRADLGVGVGVGLASSGLLWPVSFSCTFSSTFPSLMEAVDAITQDSPRAERSGVRGGFVDMTSITYPFQGKKWSNRTPPKL